VAHDEYQHLREDADLAAHRPRQAEPEDAVERCDACNGLFSTTSDRRIEAECDSSIADHDFEFIESDADPTICSLCGWMKIEHELNRNAVVHESCFLDHDDILVRV
jgi:hypothetical protein